MGVSAAGGRLLKVPRSRWLNRRQDTIGSAHMALSQLRPLLVRVVIAGASAVGAAVLDLYLTGHGYGSITGEVITWQPAGVHLSAADVLLLLAVAAALLISWRMTGRGAHTERA